MFYLKGDKVDVYANGSFRGHGEVIDASKPVVELQFRDEDDKIKRVSGPIGNSLSKNLSDGSWTINVPASMIYDV